MRLLIDHLRQLVTLAGVVRKDGIGTTWDDLGIIEDGALAVEDQTIVYAGPTAGLPLDAKYDRHLSGEGLVALPGLVDPHTHPCWAGSRHNEFAMRAEGKTYREIAATGGGIRASVSQTREASLEKLAADCADRFRRMLALGVTTVEAKSGYALNTDGELRMLRAIGQAAGRTPQQIVRTFLGAHAIPEGYDAEKYTSLIVEEMLPAIAAEKSADFCDVFVEEGYFNADQGRRILIRARDLGFGLRIHADEFAPLGGAQLAAELGAASADHLMAVDDDGIRALARAGITATLLPATTLFLGQANYAPARRLLDAGCRVALATDYNPGSSHTENLQLVFSLACTTLKMTIPEALAAVTYNAARSLLRHRNSGALLPGYRADVAMFAVEDLPAIPYHLAMNDLHWVMAQGLTFKAPLPFPEEI